MPLAQAVREVQREQRRKELEDKALAASKTVDALKAAGKLPWEIRAGDCLDVLRSLPDGCARLIFADPPYNIGVDYGDGEEADRLDDAAYVAWCGQWIAECRRVLTADGSLWVLINHEYADYLGIELRKAGFHPRARITWHETFGVNCPNNFNRCSRRLPYCVKDPKRFVFNREAVCRPSDRQAKYADPRADPAGKIWDDVWQIPRLFGTARERIPDFPTQLPLALLRPIVGCASDPGDLVIDPFSGSATTGVAAVEAGRRYLGVEKRGRFAELAVKRLKATAGRKSNGD
jgi:DNA modification methylase